MARQIITDDEGRRYFVGDDGERSRVPSDYEAPEAPNPDEPGRSIMVNGKEYYYYPAGQGYETNQGLRTAGRIAIAPGDFNTSGGFAVPADEFRADHPINQNSGIEGFYSKFIPAAIKAAAVATGFGAPGALDEGASLVSDAAPTAYQQGRILADAGGTVSDAVSPSITLGSEVAATPVVGSTAGDAIEALDTAMRTTGAQTATEAAQKLGYGSSLDYLKSINPSWVSDPSVISSVLSSPVGKKVTDAAVGTGTALVGKALVGGDAVNTDPFLESTAREEETKNNLIQRIRSIFGEGNPDAQAQFAKEDQDVADALRGQYGDQLKKQYNEAEKQFRFGAARTSNVGGSQYAHGQEQLNEENEMGATRIDDAVRRAVNDLHTSRENEKTKAIGLANAGAGEDAVLAASSGLDTALTAAKAGQKDQLFTDILGDISFAKTAGGLADRDQKLLAYLQAVKGRGSSTGVQPSNSGTIIN